VRSGGSRRRVLVIADQAASSLSNVVVAVLVARSFPEQTEPFAAFGLALMVFQFLVGCVRALVFEPVLSLYPDRPRADRDALVPGYLGSTLTVGAGVAVLVALASVLIEGMAGSALLALALVVPFVLVQDSWRYLFIIDRPGAALAVDLVWLAVSCSAIVVMPDGASVSWYVVAWGAGGALGGVVATFIGRRALGRPELWGHVVRHRQLGLRFLGEVLTSQASNYALLSCGWILGLNAYGAVRAVNFFFGPLMTLNAGLLLSILPEATRLRGQPARFGRLVYGATAVACGAAVGWTVVGLVLPESAGRAFFGVTWLRAQDVLAPMGLAVIGLGIVTTMLAGVRALDGTKGLGARLRGVPFQVGCPIVGAFAGGIMGFAIGMALGVAVSAAIWWTTFRRLYDQQRRAVAEGLTPAGPRVTAGVPSAARALAVTDEG
jgi:hypothetical protein